MGGFAQTSARNLVITVKPPVMPPIIYVHYCGHFVYHPPTDFRITTPIRYSLRGMHLNSHALSIWRSPMLIHFIFHS